MKPMLGFSIVLVTVGTCFFMFFGPRRNDAVAAQGRKPVMMYRFYTGKDGLSHAFYTAGVRAESADPAPGRGGRQWLGPVRHSRLADRSDWPRAIRALGFQYGCRRRPAGPSQDKRDGDEVFLCRRLKGLQFAKR